MTIAYDHRISLGHIISMVTILASCFLAYATLYVTQQSMQAELSTIKLEAQAKEGRLRNVEIAQASQSSDLRSIQSGIVRIETTLERMQQKP